MENLFAKHQPQLHRAISCSTNFRHQGIIKQFRRFRQNHLPGSIKLAVQVNLLGADHLPAFRGAVSVSGRS